MVGVFITARSHSVRLPGKVLEKICDKTLLELLIERVKNALTSCQMVLCTTTAPEDAALVGIAEKSGILAFRGSFEDVLARYLGAIDHYGVDQVVVVDGDDLFCEPSLVAEVAQLLTSGDTDYVQIKNMPYGSFPYGFTAAALRKVCAMKDESETEGWGRYFTQPGMFRVSTIQAQKKWAHPEYRMTLDYPEDLDFVRTVYERLYRPGRPIPLDEVFELLEAEPAVAAINGFRQEEYVKRFKEKYSHVKLKNPG